MNKFFHVFNKDTKEHITSFGRLGRGPGEFQRVPMLNDISNQDSSPIGLVYDEVARKALVIDLISSINKGELVVKKRIEFPSKLNRSAMSELLHVAGNKYAGMNDDRIFKRFNEKRCGFYFNAETENLTILPLYNLQIEPHDDLAELNLNTREARVSPDGKKLAFAMMHYPMVEVFKNGSIQRFQYYMDKNLPEGPFFKLKKFKERNLPVYYEDLFVTNKRIYLLGSKVSNNKNEKGQHVFVMDWEGNPESHYVLPIDYALSWISVDEENRTIYGISYKNDQAYKINYSQH
jgi:hypothetical protein